MGRHKAVNAPINWRIKRVHWAYKMLRFKNMLKTLIYKTSR